MRGVSNNQNDRCELVEFITTLRDALLTGVLSLGAVFSLELLSRHYRAKREREELESPNVKAGEPVYMIGFGTENLFEIVEGVYIGKSPNHKDMHVIVMNDRELGTRIVSRKDFYTSRWCAARCAHELAAKRGKDQCH